MDKFRELFLYGKNNLAWAMGLLFLLVPISVVIQFPGVLGAYLVAVMYLMVSALFFPRSVNYLNTKLNNRLTIRVRSVLILILMLVAGGVGSNIEKRFKAMSPEYREVGLKQENEEIAKKAKEREEEDVKSENERQENFYAELSAPRILYKCKNSLFVKAYGSKYGTYNQLLENAYKTCGEDNLEILEKEK